MVLSKGLVFRLVRSRAHSGCLSLRVLLSHILAQDDIPDSLVAHSCNLSIHKAELEDCCEFKASLATQ